jgi:uncharacterized membrane protein
MKNEKIKKIFLIITYGLSGFLVAVVIHAAVELPILWWQNSLDSWQPFLGFESYEEFKVFDAWLGAFQFSLGILIGLFLGFKKISNKKTK